MPPSPVPRERPAGLWSPRHRLLTGGLVLTVTLVAFEALAIATIMPIVVSELGGLALYGWVFSAFFLGSLLGIVLVGGLIDRGGLALPFVAGLGLFSVGLAAGGLAPSMEVLVAARFVQGLGAGAIPPIAYVAIGRALPENLRPRMFATLSTAWVIPGVIGPAIAGFVGEGIGWRFVFLGLLPLIAVAGALTLPSVAAVPTVLDPAAGSARRARLRSRRTADAFLIAAGAGLTLAGLTDGRLLPGVALVAGGLALGVPAFRRLTPPGTLRVRPGLPAAVLLRGLLTFAFFCADAYVPLALQEWRGTSAAVAGVALTAATLSWTAGAWIQARRYARWGARRLVAIGFLALAGGIVGFAAVLAPAVPLPVGVAAWALAGLGMGLSYATLSLTVLGEAAPGTEGSASAGLQLSDGVGTAIGTGIGGALIAAAHAAGMPLWLGLAAAFAVGAAFALLGVGLATRLPGPTRARPAPAAVAPGEAAA